ncbi:hypothetical protein V8C86DRAFT_1403767 [Haematococcus lacustris]
MRCVANYAPHVQLLFRRASGPRGQAHLAAHSNSAQSGMPLSDLTLHALDMDPPSPALGARVEHLLVQYDSQAAIVLQDMLQAPAWFVERLIWFGAVYYCPVVPLPGSGKGGAKPPPSSPHQQHVEQQRAVGLARWGRGSDVQTPQRLACGQTPVHSGGYMRVHLHPKRFPAATAIRDWRARVIALGPYFVAVDKPPGVQVPCTVDNVRESLVACVEQALGLQPGSLHPAHRLDGGTSGVVLLSRTPAFARYFQQQVQAKPGAEGEATPGVAGAAAGTGAGPEAGQGSAKGMQEAAGTTADDGSSSRQGGRAAKEHSGWQQQQPSQFEQQQQQQRQGSHLSGGGQEQVEVLQPLAREMGQGTMKPSVDKQAGLCSLAAATVMVAKGAAAGVAAAAASPIHSVPPDTSVRPAALNPSPPLSPSSCSPLAPAPRPRPHAVKTYRCLTAHAPALGRLQHWVRTQVREPGLPEFTQPVPDTQAAPDAKLCVLQVDEVFKVDLRPDLQRLWGVPYAFESHITLLTGRTHQIRAQLAATGNPVLGDALYSYLSSRPHWAQVREPSQPTQDHHANQAPLPDYSHQPNHHDQLDQTSCPSQPQDAQQHVAACVATAAAMPAGGEAAGQATGAPGAVVPTVTTGGGEGGEGGAAPPPSQMQPGCPQVPSIPQPAVKEEEGGTPVPPSTPTPFFNQLHPLALQAWRMVVHHPCPDMFRLTPENLDQHPDTARPADTCYPCLPGATCSIPPKHHSTPSSLHDPTGEQPVLESSVSTRGYSDQQGPMCCSADHAQPRMAPRAEGYAPAPAAIVGGPLPPAAGGGAAGASVPQPWPLSGGVAVAAAEPTKTKPEPASTAGPAPGAAATRPSGGVEVSPGRLVFTAGVPWWRERLLL